MKTKVMVVFGTRPEAIKMAPIIHALRKNQRFATIVCVTSQHRQMLSQVLSTFEITPDYDLDLMEDGQSPVELTAKVLVQTKDLFEKEKPDLVLVQGDTTTTFATALSAFHHGLSIGHIEAGLRTWDLNAPFPEEANRVLTTRIANFHFCPTDRCKNNLIAEGVAPQAICVTGNTVVDAFISIKERIRSMDLSIWRDAFGDAYRPIADRDRRIVLITGHRRENFGAGIDRMCIAIKQLSKKFSEIDFVYPVHLNPNVHRPVHEHLGGISNIYLINPIEYMPFLYLMERASLILTDSGGVQEEAPSLGKPVLVMREKTERLEGLEAGMTFLVGTDIEKIVKVASRILMQPKRMSPEVGLSNPYGDGFAAQRTVEAITQWMAKQTLNGFETRELGRELAA